MKGFRFRGEKILEWRRAQADAARGEYLRAAETAREAARLADAAQRRAEQAVTDSMRILREPVGIDAIQRHRIWIDRERWHADGCRRTQQAEEKVADEKSRLLQVANRNVKVMERLRERAEHRHREVERQQEMKIIDELATQRFAVRRTE